ncbi:hypothetical protein NUU61_005266 [Penicillium alfredii]|uniref:Uncharacterized protein n=1 Tax=Penicillium alfredii TaxID=1506179 RepID=A0A9W9K7P8_9EURO|nr:uncharacterized protein NUU61_005266 [Penicillium alfredii]KAJ5095910.1 hypothetical protein NUU61_005266 [Penicillium alfredii]
MAAGGDGYKLLSVTPIDHFLSLRLLLAKLTGAGGGGFAIVLPRSDVKGDDEQALKEDLAMEGFEKYEMAGVGLLFPALFRNGSDGEIEGVNFDAFENALDARSIEDLVGIGGQADREGWLFWSRS